MKFWSEKLKHKNKFYFLSLKKCVELVFNLLRARVSCHSIDISPSHPLFLLFFFLFSLHFHLSLFFSSSFSLFLSSSLSPSPFFSSFSHIFFLFLFLLFISSFFFSSFFFFFPGSHTDGKIPLGGAFHSISNE